MTQQSKRDSESWEKTDIECFNCEDGRYERHAGSKAIACENCFHAPPDGNEKQYNVYEVSSNRPRYKNSGNVVMDGAFPYLGHNDIVSEDGL